MAALLTTVPCAASSLLCDVVDTSTSRTTLVEVARTRVSVHYETGSSDVPVLCVCTPDAVRLPASLVSYVVPSGAAVLDDGRLYSGATTWQVTRWWRPPRPRGLTVPKSPPAMPAGVWTLDDIRPHDLVGRGPGLTPSGDDVLAGALVAANATGDPRLEGWRSKTAAALDAHGTTAVSRGLLWHAMDGWATPELAAFVTAACTDRRSDATARLLAVGHTSGAALAAGALHVLTAGPSTLRAAA